MWSDAAACVRADWHRKARWSLALVVFFCVPYFVLQRVVLMPVRTLPLTVIDEAIGFDPGWAAVYQSGYLLMAVVPWVLDRRADLDRYIRGFAAVSLVGFACFVALPIAGPRPAIVPDYGMFGVLATYDRPTNAFPSLHAALLAFTVAIGARASEGRVAPIRRVVLLSIAVAWSALVALAALETKQHYAVDIPAGLLVTLAIWRGLP